MFNNNKIKKTIKASNGITLIALVITIIVLLILAGISISMLAGDNSILQKATDAKINTEKAQIIENAQTDILGQQTENKSASITKEQLVAILNKYFEDTAITSIPDEVSSEQGHDYELTTIDNKYIIMLSEIFKGKFKTTEEGVAYVIGDYITINGEGFYVIENSPANKSTVKIFAEKNIDTETNKQSDTASTPIFDSSTYEYINSSIKDFVDSYITALGVNVIDGRLITLDELYALGLLEDPVNTGTSEGLPNYITNTTYWLETPCINESGNHVLFVDGSGMEAQYPYENWYGCGVRPVIEILKTDIPN